MKHAPSYVLVLICLAVFIAQVSGQPGRETKDTPAYYELSLKKPIREVTFDDAPVREVVDFLQDAAHVNLYLDHAAFKSAGIDISKTRINVHTAAEGPLEAVLKDVIAQVGTKEHPAAFAARGEVIVISTKQGALDFVERHHKALAHVGDVGGIALVRQVPEFVTHGTFEGAIEQLRDKSLENIFVDWKKLEAAGITRETPVALRLHDVPLGQAIRLVLDESQPTVEVGIEMRDHVIYITTVAAPKEGL